MSPRGVATPDVRERLLHAAERVLVRDGPDGATARAVTREAGCATGVLYVHFTDLDEFLAEVVRERWRLLVASIADLPDRAGTATVTDNLTDAASKLLEAPVIAVVRLVLARPSMRSQAMAAFAATPTPMLTQLEDAVARYLEAERKLGRVKDSADPHATAMLWFGALFHLIMHHLPRTPEPDQARDPDEAQEPDEAQQRALVRRVVTALQVGLAP